jgi:hypothetical protein
MPETPRQATRRCGAGLHFPGKQPQMETGQWRASHFRPRVRRVSRPRSRSAGRWPSSITHRSQRPRRGPAAEWAARISGFSAATHSKWLGEQIAATTASLVACPPQAFTDALTAVLVRLETKDRDRDVTLGAVFTLRCRLLEALNVTDFRLRKAYGLGRALAETALVRRRPPRVTRNENSASCWAPGGSARSRTGSVELKTVLPDHAAYAVSRGLDDWRDWVAPQRTPADWRNAQTARS